MKSLSEFQTKFLTFVPGLGTAARAQKFAHVFSTQTASLEGSLGVDLRENEQKHVRDGPSKNRVVELGFEQRSIGQKSDGNRHR